MPLKRELSPGQVQEIQALRGRLPANEVKKRFGIGSTRFYEIWRGKPVAVVSQPHASPSEPAALPLPLPSEEEEPDSTLRRNAQNLLPIGETNVGAEPREHATVEDFYKRLEGLESQAEQSTRMLTEVLVEVLASRKDRDVFLDELGDVVKELPHSVATRRRAEGGPRRADRDQDGPPDVETAQRWAYISLAAILVWKVVGATWKRCFPSWEQRDSNSASARRPRARSRACCGATHKTWGPILHGLGLGLPLHCNDSLCELAGKALYPGCRPTTGTKGS